VDLHPRRIGGGNHGVGRVVVRNQQRSAPRVFGVWCLVWEAWLGCIRAAVCIRQPLCDNPQVTRCPARDRPVGYGTNTEPCRVVSYVAGRGCKPTAFSVVSSRENLLFLLKKVALRLLVSRRIGGNGADDAREQSIEGHLRDGGCVPSIASTQYSLFINVSQGSTVRGPKFVGL